MVCSYLLTNVPFSHLVYQFSHTRPRRLVDNAYLVGLAADILQLLVLISVLIFLYSELLTHDHRLNDMYLLHLSVCVCVCHSTRSLSTERLQPQLRSTVSYGALAIRLIQILMWKVQNHFSTSLCLFPARELTALTVGVLMEAVWLLQVSGRRNCSGDNLGLVGHDAYQLFELSDPARNVSRSSASLCDYPITCHNFNPSTNPNPSCNVSERVES